MKVSRSGNRQHRCWPDLIDQLAGALANADTATDTTASANANTQSALATDGHRA